MLDRHPSRAGRPGPPGPGNACPLQAACCQSWKLLKCCASHTTRTWAGAWQVGGASGQEPLPAPGRTPLCMSSALCHDRLWHATCSLTGARTALQMAAQAQQQHQGQARRIRTSCPALDQLLGGGVARGAVTEFCGVPGVGKTQLGCVPYIWLPRCRPLGRRCCICWPAPHAPPLGHCRRPPAARACRSMQLVLNVQLPPARGGLGGRAVYIDSEGSFMADRAAEMAAAAAQGDQQVGGRWPPRGRHARGTPRLHALSWWLP